MIPENSYLRIAKIRSAHGLDGRFKIYVITDIEERFSAGNRVFLKLGENYKEFEIEAYTPQKKRGGLLRLKGIKDRNEAEKYSGAEVFIDAETAEKTRPELGDDTFFYRDIIGCTVLFKGEKFGTVTDIFEGGAGDLLQIEDLKKKTVLIPFVEQMVKTDKIPDGFIEIDPVEGLLDF